jgi:hypothetical protein
MTSRTMLSISLLGIAWTAGCGRGDAGGGDDGGSPFGDTGGLIAVDPTGGNSGGASSSGTGGASTSGGASSSGGATTSSGVSGTSSTGSSGGGSSSGGGTNGGSTSGGSSSGGGGACPTDVICSGALPYCDLNRSPPACVAGATDTLGEFCFSDTDCNFGESGTGVVCDLFFTCAPGCWSDGDCPGDQPYCDTNSFFPACVAGPSDTLGEACFQDTDCNFGLPESQVVCTSSGCAAGCHLDTDCSPTECCDGFWDPGLCTPC